MNIAHTNTKSAQGVPFRGAVLVRRLALCCLMACAGMSTAQAAGYGDQRQQRSEPGDRRDRGQQAQRDHQREDDAREEQRRQQQAQQDRQDQQNDRRGGRLTPDERRDLRRQINEAGSDIYRNAPRR